MSPLEDTLHAPTATLLAPWMDAETPLEEEVRLAIRVAMPQARLSQEVLETDEDVRWAFSLSMPEGQDAFVWCEELDFDGPLGMGQGTPPALLEQRADRASLERARKARFAVGIESTLVGDEACEAWQRQLTLVLHAAVPGLEVVLDEDARMVRSGQSVRELVSAPVAPGIASLYAVHIANAPGGAWLATHGLARAGLPELDLIEVPGDEVSAAHEVLRNAVERLAAGGRPDTEDRLALGEALFVRAESLETVTERFARERLPTGLRNLRGMGERLLLLDVREDVPPIRALDAQPRPKLVARSAADARRRRALALARWGVFGQVFARREADWRFHVQLAFERPAPSEAREHLWFQVTALRPGACEVELLSRAVGIPGFPSEGRRWESLDRLSDWRMVDPSGLAWSPERCLQLVAEA